MKPWVHLDTARVPGGGELRLMRRDVEYSIMAGPIELMNSRLSGSEEALAKLTADRLRGRVASAVLIGGLGMGFTLRAALAAFPRSADIVVAELVPEVVAWARSHLQPLYAGSLEDRRVSVRETDVGALIAAAKGRYDAILLDVDNGPDGLTREGNDALYDAEGLARAHRALRPGGVLAVWSSEPNRAFSGRLRAASFKVEEVKVAARSNGRGARHVIWMATKG